MTTPHARAPATTAADRPNRHDRQSDHAMSIASLSQSRMMKQWLTLELPEEQTIETVHYDTHWPGQPGDQLWQESFRISVSTDGKSFTPIITKSALTKAQRFELKVTPVSAKYVRVDNIRSQCKRLSFWHGAYVTELQVYASSTRRGPCGRRPRQRR